MLLPFHGSGLGRAVGLVCVSGRKFGIKLARYATHLFILTLGLVQRSWTWVKVHCYRKKNVVTSSEVFLIGWALGNVSAWKNIALRSLHTSD